MELQVFNSTEFGSVRTATVNGEAMFVGKDVADILGYQNGSRDINRHVDEEDRHKVMLFDGNQDKETIIINESGLYSLILSSKLPRAKEFKHWVTSEILPSIRKTGGYGVTNNNAELFAEITSLRQEVAEIKSLVTPTQCNYYLWKNSIATPLIKTISNILGLPIADTYKVIYDDMVLRGFNQSYAMNRFCNKYKVDSVSTIDAVADVDEYIRMFMDSANKLLEMNTTTSDTSIVKSEVNNNINTTNSIIDYSS